jgi:capsid protein
MPGTEVERMPMSPREQLEQKLAVIETRARDLAQRHGRLAAGIALTAAAAFGLGILVYRRRGRKSMMQRAQRAIPDSVRDMPEELIARLKKRSRR